jgi:protein-tyrosine-phosphatase
MGSVCISRRVVLGVAVSATIGCAHQRQARPTRVLFVCTYGTVKSAIAREHLRRMARTRGIPLEVTSRGLTPEDHRAPALVAALAAEGIDARADPLRALSQADLDNADVVIAFDTLPAPFAAPAVRDWSDAPSMNANYEKARDWLVARLSTLLDEIEAR